MKTIGHIDLIKDEYIHGWLGSHSEEVIPVITANGTPCKLLGYHMERPDVADVTGLSPLVGFVCETPPAQTGALHIKLYALTSSGKLSLIDSVEVNKSKQVFASPQVQTKGKKNVVLIWKQHDAGLYGRRVDQIGRALAATQDYQNVYILELISSQQLASYKDSASLPESDKKFIYEDYCKKTGGFIFNGVIYKTLLMDEEQGRQNIIESYLSDNAITSDNSLFILFPLISQYWQVLNAIQDCVAICDCVDNQVVWSQDNPTPVLQQYANLCLFAKKVIFNSSANRKFFIKNSYCTTKKSALIENWYKLPTDFQARNKISGPSEFNIVYSGNMNDRINWELIKKLHDATDNNINIHLIGSADIAIDNINRLIECSERFVFHGPMRENDLLSFLQTCDLAIMPHIHDSCSTFMNPLKLHMYAALGLHCVTTFVPGIDSSLDHITISKNDSDFIAQCIKFIEHPVSKKRLFRFNKDKHMKAYINMVNKILRSF